MIKGVLAKTNEEKAVKEYLEYFICMYVIGTEDLTKLNILKVKHKCNNIIGTIIFI